MTEDLGARRRAANGAAEAEFERLHQRLSEALDEGDVATAKRLGPLAKAAADRYFATLTEAERAARFGPVPEEPS